MCWPAPGGPRVLLAPTYYQRLHALAITTGAEKFAGPVEIQASMSGTGRGSSNGKLVFNPLRDNPRAAMLLNNGVVYLTWASSCDVGAYHGWSWLMTHAALSKRRSSMPLRTGMTAASGVVTLGPRQIIV